MVLTKSKEYVQRFSMCDCITLHRKNLPNVYTAHGAGLELFLKRLWPGRKWYMPYVNKLDDETLRQLRPVAYTIPKNVDTFIWSTFHDGVSSYWDLGDGVRYAYRSRGSKLKKLGIAKHVPAPPESELRQQVIELDQKVTKMWGSDLVKILLLYDNSRCTREATKDRLDRFTAIAKEVLDWPVVQVQVTENDPPGPGQPGMTGTKWLGWDHYSKETSDKMCSDIIQIEQNARREV
jgi:hypothetical protein